MVVFAKVRVSATKMREINGAEDRWGERWLGEEAGRVAMRECGVQGLRDKLIPFPKVTYDSRDI